MQYQKVGSDTFVYRIAKGLGSQKHAQKLLREIEQDNR